MADATLRATAPAEAAAPFSRGGETTNNVRTYVLRGQLVAQPYSTGARKRPADSIYGKVNTILNPPNLDRSSTYSRQHNMTAVTVQTAGTVHKKKVPYSMTAPRNCLNNPEAKRPPPFSSTLDLKCGGVLNSTVYPYRTISRTVQKPTTTAMETRIGCAFPAPEPLAPPLPPSRRPSCLTLSLSFSALLPPCAPPPAGTNADIMANMSKLEHAKLWK
jgi:hypothetical protein